MDVDPKPIVDLQSAIAAVSSAYDADILLINSGMDSGLTDRVRSVIDRLEKRRPNLVLLLVTSGGLADEAYRCGRLLQNHYEKISVCIAGWCKSAGTLLAIAGHDLLIGKKGELGPLDVQLVKRDELFDRDSGLISNAALDRLRAESFQTFEETMLAIIAKSQNAITFRTAADVAAEITVGLMSPVFDKIDPMRLGTDARAMEIGSAYAIRLNMKSENLRSMEALNMLLNGYPSHSFVIDYMEAEALFNIVKPSDATLVAIEERLGEMATIPLDEAVICFLEMKSDENKNSLGQTDVADAESGQCAANDSPPVEGPAEVVRKDIQAKS